MTDEEKLQRIEEKAHLEKGKLKALNTRMVKDKDGKDAIVYYVPKKLPEPDLLKMGVEIAPKDIDGIPVHVVELNPEGWKAGPTKVSELSPKNQRRLLGVIGKD